MSSLEPTPAAVTKAEPSAYRYNPDDPTNETPSVRKLWTRVRWLFVLNISLVIASGFQAYFSFRSNELTRQTLNRTSEQHREMMRVTKDVNSATLRQTERFAVSSQRPWVGIDQKVVPTSFIFNSPTEFMTSFELTTRNFGQTPAFKVAMGTITALSISEATTSADNACSLASLIPIRGVDLDMNRALIHGQTLFPNQELRVPTRRVISVGTINEGLYLVGCILYGDVFGTEPTRKTTFCYMSPYRNTVDTRTPFHQCPFGNTAE